MVERIKDAEVAGIITANGKCPACKMTLVIREKDYTFIKNRGTAEFDNGERYIKCLCGRFVMRPKGGGSVYRVKQEMMAQ